MAPVRKRRKVDLSNVHSNINDDDLMDESIIRFDKLN